VFKTPPPGYALHPLKGDLEGHWAVRVSGNWRLIFAFEGENAILGDYPLQEVMVRSTK